jgi:hypothetical protein
MKMSICGGLHTYCSLTVKENSRHGAVCQDSEIAWRARQICCCGCDSESIIECYWNDSETCRVARVYIAVQRLLEYVSILH